ncbi:hypothetical protein ASPCADRAFT_6941 [Aspergillus carbonarius ITEM 5010]|uniref:Uncharacterized protein n=1 Tax=Aspergillus carbonarius (strain ITEM 5010) TaxID=602072 RepID=A0A1R3RID9_ASPC5|nr:hypothetical protein ASPCADRAFT_6941 [Aspergillus carbonarius ITEM 5010]
MSQSRFHIRPASPSTDSTFILTTFDACLPYLASIGSTSQWGTTPFTDRPNWTTETLQEIQSAATSATILCSSPPSDNNNNNNNNTDNNNNPLHIFIIESEFPPPNTPDTPPSQHIPIGFAYIRENWIPKYLSSRGILTPEDISSGIVSSNPHIKRELPPPQDFQTTAQK